MTVLARAQRPDSAVGAAPATLDALANTARREIDLSQEAFRRGLDHALRAGEALNEAQELIPRGAWIAWLKEQGIKADNAKQYMRVAAFRDSLPPGTTSIRDALAYLRDQGMFRRTPRGLELGEEIHGLLREGASARDVADRTGVHVATV